MFLNFRFAPPAAHRTIGLAVLLGLGCLCLSIGCLGSGGSTTQNGTLSHEGTVNIPPDTTVEIVYPAPFATPPTLTIYAWHSDWEVKEQNEKSFRIRNKSQSKPRSVEWKARGVRVVPPPPTTQYKMIRSMPDPAVAPLKQEPLPTNTAPPQTAQPVQLGPPKQQ